MAKEKETKSEVVGEEAAAKEPVEEVKAESPKEEAKAETTANPEIKEEKEGGDAPAKEEKAVQEEIKAETLVDEKPAAEAETKDESEEQSAVPVEAKTETKEEETTAKKKPEQEKPAAEKPAPAEPEEFDWEAFETKGFGEGYSKEQREEMAQVYEQTLTTIEEHAVIKGRVVDINDRDVILNIGFKSDGLVSAAEFRDMTDLKVGDEVEVYVEEQENAQGQLILSRRKAKIFKAWDMIQHALDYDEVIEGLVKRRTKGGLIVDIYGVEAFLPGSQIDVKPIRDFDVFVDKAMEVKVIKINYSNDNVVVSHKVLIEKDLEQQKAEILNNLEKGQVLQGTIKNMTNFGVFIDLGGVDGLLHITDISWGRINHPEEALNLDQEVKVVVLDFDEDKKRISLGMKQLTPHPWDSLPEDIQVGSKVKGKIVNVADYGAFLEIMPGVEGLIHVSEMSWSQHLRNPSDFISIGDELEAVVLTIDREERKMSLGIKQLTEDPWTKQDVLTKYAVGTKHKGVVRNLTNFGLFIELEEGIDGLVHVSDLSWTKKIKHPSEFVKVSDELEVVVMELDVENRRLALSHKHLEENPWDTFETVFTPGSIHKCTIVELNEKGAVLELPYGIEGFCPGKNLAKEDGSKSEVGESLEFRVTEFSKDEKRIILSHKAVYSKQEERPKAKKKGPKTKTIDKINQEVERDTLGDLEALSSLKEQMEGSAAAKQEKPKAEKQEKPKVEKKEVKAEAEKKEAKAEVEEKEVKAEEVKAEVEEKEAPVEKAPVKEKPVKEKPVEEKKEENEGEATEEEAK